MQLEELKKIVIDALEDIKAEDISEIDVRGKTDITDIMIMACGRSSRQVKSLANNVIVKAKQHGVRPLGVEGEKEGEWILVDLGDIVVHIMQPEIRDFYGLERLWSVSAPKESNGFEG